MKTLYKNIKNGNQAVEKRRELENKTGLKLTRYSVGDGVQFRPYLHIGIVEDSTYKNKILVLLENNKYGLSFTKMADETGLTIIQVLSTVQYLYNRRLVTSDISRDGKIIGVHLYQK